MHLLATQSGVVDGNAEAVDLAQTPADIIIISAADSELAALANAYTSFVIPAQAGIQGDTTDTNHLTLDSRLRGNDGRGRGNDQAPTLVPTLRLANQMALGHNLSVDTYIENTAQHARLIIVRVLGGKAYWNYGVEQLASLARQQNILLALLPGGAEQDAELTSLSTLPVQSCERIRQYISHGGAENAQNLLKFCTSLLDDSQPLPPPPLALQKAGLYRQTEKTGTATIAITFYRALIEGGLTAPVDALIEATEALGNKAVAIFV